MKLDCISLHAPWAYWVALEWKRVETRLHNRFYSLKGKRIGIHVAKHYDLEATSLASLYLLPWQAEKTRNIAHTGSELICSAYVDDSRVCKPEDSASALIDCAETVRYGLFLSNIEVFAMPFPINGHQGIFQVEL